MGGSIALEHTDSYTTDGGQYLYKTVAEFKKDVRGCLLPSDGVWLQSCRMDWMASRIVHAGLITLGEHF